MATSPNFGWPEPNDSDYVKNGALAMRTLGDAIDSTVYSIDVRVTAAEASIAGLINPFLLMGA
ncbi:hypothetical protein UFOVP1281_13 [uncultured Caudovirales phage]|uniref:Uncharacterized protein n=1 Tax=uncultured Caudovirales phage TaxID=2100421 RepID=A0A6J5RSU2_9CAUD|nr:hypothetical protein UFOVP1281_13 [uncultured Caudovirales phage]